MIPWAAPGAWAELTHAMRGAVERSGAAEDGRIRARVNAITKGYGILDGDMVRLCDDTCPSCSAVCCKHATVWYDFRDLLFISLSEQRFPDEQLRKSPSGVCFFLGPRGCSKPRLERPFICTWYICQQQRELLSDGYRLTKNRIEGAIVDMQNERKALEDDFCRLCV